MTMNFANGYGYNPYLNNNTQFNNVPPQLGQPQSSIIFVSNIAEANTTKPDVTGKPLFFYNKADEEFYIKKYDDFGLAPLKVYKLIVESTQTQSNPIVDSIKNLNDKLDDIKKLLTPEVIEETEKRSKK